jgi:hypothetical protein
MTRWAALVVLSTIAGGVFLLVSGVSALSTRAFVDRATRAEGVVVSLNAGSAHPQVEFALPSGEKLSFPAGGFISYNKGERAKVLYRPEAPSETARLDDFGELWLPDLASALLGSVVLLFGLNGLRSARRRKAPPPSISP